MSKSVYTEKRWQIILYSILGLLILLGILVAVQRLFYSNYRIPPELVWSKVMQESAIYDLEPSFVFAVVFAESSFRPRANSVGGNGIMQVSQATWGDMSNQPYELARISHTDLGFGDFSGGHPNGQCF